MSPDPGRPARIRSASAHAPSATSPDPARPCAKATAETRARLGMPHDPGPPTGAGRRETPESDAPSQTASRKPDLATTATSTAARQRLFCARSAQHCVLTGRTEAGPSPLLLLCSGHPWRRSGPCRPCSPLGPSLLTLLRYPLKPSNATAPRLSHARSLHLRRLPEPQLEGQAAGAEAGGRAAS